MTMNVNVEFLTMFEKKGPCEISLFCSLCSFFSLNAFNTSFVFV